VSPEETFRTMVEQGDVISNVLLAAAKRTPHKTFIYYGEDDRAVSYGEFQTLVDRLAAGLQQLGVNPDDRVSVFTRNAFVSALSMFAIWRIGAVYCPINFLYKGKLLAHQLSDTAPRSIISDISMSAILAEIADQVPVASLVIHVPKSDEHDYTTAEIGSSSAGHAPTYPLEDILADRAAEVRLVTRTFADIANIVYTSGTTGAAKGVVQPFRWINQYTFLSRQLLSEDDVIYCDLPLYHVGGAFYLVGKAAWLGATVALYDRFSPVQYWDRINKSRVTHAVLVDVMSPWLMSIAPKPSDRENTLNKVHMQPLPGSHNAIARRFGIDFVITGFGQTESGLGFISLIDECDEGEGTPSTLWKGHSKDEIRSRARRFEMMIVDGFAPLPKGFMGRPSSLLNAAALDSNDMPCAAGQVGQLAFRPRFPELLLKSYFNRPEAMVKVSSNYWFHTGDACYRDGDGTFFFVDRMGDVFRVRGEKVSSYQVEDLLNGHPKIRAVAAVPVPAAEGDEEDCAVFVQLIDGEAMSADELMAHAKAVMPKYMLPKYIRFVDELPLTATNKVEKYKLKQSLMAELLHKSSAP